MEGVSVDIWSLISKGLQPPVIYDEISKKYNVEIETVINDVNDFLLELHSKKLIFVYLDSGKQLKLDTVDVNSGKNSRHTNVSLFQWGWDNDIPITVDYHITDICNLRCLHCYSEDYRKSGQRKLLDLPEIYDAFDQLSILGTFFVRIFGGGEPFAHHDIMDVLRYGRKKDFALSLVTNGTLLSEEIIRDLRDIKLRSLAFSIHGATPRTHDRFVGVHGSFTRLIENLQHCLKYQVPVELSWAITKETYCDLDKALALAKDFDVPISINPRITPQEMSGSLSPKALRITDRQLADLMENHNYIPTPQTCSVGSKILIKGDGKVYPCLFLPESIGNIREMPIGQIWNSPRRKDLLHNPFFGQPDNCKVCTIKSFCHRCPGIAKMESNSLIGCSEMAKWEAATYNKVRGGIIND